MVVAASCPRGASQQQALKGLWRKYKQENHQFLEKNLNQSAMTQRIQTQAKQKLVKDSKWLLGRGHVNAQISIKVRICSWIQE